MKKILTLLAAAGLAASSYGQGTVSWQNSASTLISAGGVSTANVAGQYYFAIFLAPSSTVGAAGQTASFTDGAFQSAAAYNTNAAAAGRIATRSTVDPGVASGTTVDFIIRGWSANAGSTWAAALAFWNNGNPSQTMYMGSTPILNDFVVGGGSLPVSPLMGTTLPQAPGFNLLQYNPVPEPTSMALAGLGAASLLIFRRRK